MIAGFLSERNDLVVAVVQGWSREIVHRGIHDHKILHAGLLHELDTRDEDAAVAGDESPGLDQHFQAQWFEQRDELRSVLRGSEQVFPLGRTPPLGLSAFECGVVNDTKPATDAKKLDAVLVGQALGQGDHFFDSLFERPHFSELRADMHLQSPDVQVFQLRSPLVNRFDLLKCDSEFILVSASGDLGVRFCIDVRVNPYGDGCLLFQPTSHLVDTHQFRFALGVKCVNTLL